MDHAKLTAANQAAAIQAETDGDTVVNAWPLKLTLELTADCNLHCFMCDCEMARDRYRAKGYKKFALPVEIFRQIAEASFSKISVINPTVVGEPLMLPYYDEMLEACAHYNVKLDIISNGMLLKGERARKLLPVLSELTISFDGGTKETFEHVRTGSTFETVVENLNNFSKMRDEAGLTETVGLTFNTTILTENLEELPRIIELGAAAKVDVIDGAFMLVFAESLRHCSPLSDPVRANHWVAKAEKRAKELGIRVSLPNPLPEDGSADVQVAQSDADFGGVVEANGEQPAAPAEVTNGSAPQAAPEDEGEAPAGSAERLQRAASKGAMPADRVPAEWGGKLYCRFPWREAFVGQGGEISPCCAQGRPVLGNAFEQDFAEIWNGKDYQALRKGLWEGKPLDYCKNCTFLQESGAVPYSKDAYMRD